MEALIANQEHDGDRARIVNLPSRGFSLFSRAGKPTTCLGSCYLYGMSLWEKNTSDILHLLKDRFENESL